MAITLISCDGCAVVLDASKLSFKDSNHMHHDDGSINDEVAVWDGDQYVPYVRCPVCDEQILKGGT